jgi:uncharacterized membrane protein HdeD (DUF308 family)
MKNLGSDLPSPAPSMPTHPLTGFVATLRRVAFMLLLAGVAETAVWFGNVRLVGTSGGTFTSIAVGVIAGTLLLAAAMTVTAFILDLLIAVNSGKTNHHGTVEARPLTTV